MIRKKPGCGRPVLPSASSEALGQEESSNPQRISKKMGDLGSGKDGISPIPCGSGMENWEDMAETIYRICWRRRVAIRDFEKMGGLGIRRRRHLSYTLWVGDGEMQKNGRLGIRRRRHLSYILGSGWKCPGRCIRKLYPWVGMEMSWTMHPEKTRPRLQLPQSISRRETQVEIWGVGVITA